MTSPLWKIAVTRKIASTILYNLESKTPVLLSKHGFGLGSYFRRGLTLEHPNDTVLGSEKKIVSWNIYAGSLSCNQVLNYENCHKYE